ncbi:MAG: DUF4292 domain-containing protein [candidate division KSB1 bacterium]|nr:DUF4292 domain-containing protein [candidate division KSB1 bacterium]MDZ7274850.1 DUF4292 domain-containing protein [candidate division KSB1 bacterium]MDZ7288217.1 DUF4292 domain-containing protein [candidate division KSB1 bacterium]MDZ7300402.1 DUF4292 domain-containing protein [candidate division KSB1 bacterium]MDZ7308777.1 DUF4292 domain-containing protein [candidate division KSB1 bacterium]
MSPLRFPAGGTRRTGFTLLFGSLLLQGCAALSTSRKPAVSATAAEVYLQVVENYRRVKSFRGTGRLIIDTPGLQTHAPATVLVRKPDSMFIKLEAVFGIDVGFFFADGHRFETYSPLENTYFYGDLGGMQALLLFQMEITYDELMSSAVGTILPPFDSTFTMTPAEGAYRFDGRRGQWQVTYWVDGSRGAVTLAEQRDENGLYARQTFRSFRKVEGVWLPRLIQIDKPRLRERLTLFYDEVRLNRNLAQADFSMRVPASARRIRVTQPADDAAGQPDSKP